MYYYCTIILLYYLCPNGLPKQPKKRSARSSRRRQEKVMQKGSVDRKGPTSLLYWWSIKSDSGTKDDRTQTFFVSGPAWRIVSKLKKNWCPRSCTSVTGCNLVDRNFCSARQLIHHSIYGVSGAEIHRRCRLLLCLLPHTRARCGA